MRLMSCSLTTQQVRDRTKTVTRRLGWRNVKPGELLCICEKVMGRQGKPLVRLAVVKVVKVSREPLNLMALCEDYGRREAIKEGFPELDGYQFVKMFVNAMGCDESTEVTRIEWRYVPGGRSRKAVSDDD
jgi:hypothetical protein